MSAMMVFGIRPSNPGDPTILTDRWFPSLKFLSSKKLAEVIQESVHQNSESTEPWKTHQWQTARVHLCQNLVPSLLKELHKKFLEKGYYVSNTCYHCFNDLKSIVGFRQICPNKVQGMLIDWLCDPGWNPAYIRPCVFDLEHDSALLSIDNLYVTHISLCNPSNLGEPLGSLPKLIHLQDIILIYWAVNDGDTFDLLAKHCHLRKFEFRRVDYLDPTSVPFKAIDKLLKFLQSQAHCLQEIIIKDSFCRDDDNPEHAKMIWNVLAELRHLTKLEWLSSSLIRVSGKRNMKPLQQLHTLKLTVEYTHQSIEKIPFERMFPALEDYWLLYEFHNIRHLSLTKYRGKVTLGDVTLCTSFKFESIAANFTELFPSLKTYDTSLEVIPEQLKISNLTNLAWGGIERLSFDELKAPFWSMPNLIKCVLIAKVISNFDEKKFICFLADTIHLRKKLKSLHLLIEQHPVAMTGATACAILRYSQIETFEKLSSFKFSSNEMEELESLACQKYLTILPAYKCGRRIHSCDSGEHKE